MSLQTYIIVAVTSYLLGAIPFGYILVRVFMDQDIRATGSGNIGATNVARSGAKGLAIATLALDALKGSAAVLLASTMAAGWRAEHANEAVELRAFASLLVILGHCFPAWLKFRGGKGVATAMGAFIVLTPKALFIALGVFLIIVALTKYVSLGSVIAAIAVPIGAYYFGMPSHGLILLSASCLVVILKHHQNIGRLAAGTENRWGAKPA